MELGCSTLGFRFDPLEVALNEIKDQGFQCVDLAMYPGYCPHFNPLTATESDRERLLGALAELGLTVATLNASDGLLGVPAERQSAVEYAQASLRLAQEVGAYGVTMQSGVEPPPGEWLDVAKVVASDVRELGEYAESLGLELTLELHKSMLMATGQEAVDLMALIDHPHIGVTLDPSHATHAGEQAADVALKLGSVVKHVHLRDAIGKDIMVVPGDGAVDFAALAQALASIGYRRAAVIELEYERAKASEVRFDLARAKTVLAPIFT